MPQYKANGLSNNAAHMQAFGNAVLEHDTTVLPAALALNDTVDLLRVAGGTKLIELWKTNGDCDTGTTLQYSLGYRRANSDGVITPVANYFGAALTDLQAAVTGTNPTRYAFAPITFDEDVFITATITAAATGMSGNPRIDVFAHGIARGIK
jgi:hypothetical protein